MEDAYRNWLGYCYYGNKDWDCPIARKQSQECSHCKVDRRIWGQFWRKHREGMQ